MFFTLWCIRYHAGDVPPDLVSCGDSGWLRKPWREIAPQLGTMFSIISTRGVHQIVIISGALLVLGIAKALFQAHWSMFVHWEIHSLAPNSFWDFQTYIYLACLIIKVALKWYWQFGRQMVSSSRCLSVTNHFPPGEWCNIFWELL